MYQQCIHGWARRGFQFSWSAAVVHFEFFDEIDALRYLKFPDRRQTPRLPWQPVAEVRAGWMPNATTFLKRRRIVALAILSPAFQRLKTQSPAGGKDRQRHMLASHWRKVSGIGLNACPTMSVSGLPVAVRQRI
jgi:hypothetical protein